MELNNDLNTLMTNYPSFELSYETVSQKGDLSLYDVCLAIPTGKKAFIWHTFQNEKDIAYLLDVNRNKQIYKNTILDEQDVSILSHNTIVYGTIIEVEEEINSYKIFVIEDIYFFKGLNLKSVSFTDKLYYFKQYINAVKNNIVDFVFALPYMWNFTYNINLTELPFTIENNISEKIAYEPHHLQYRCKGYIVPYINVSINRKLTLTTQKGSINNNVAYMISRFTMDTSKPQYKYTANFQVKAAIQNDIYYLFAFGNKKTLVYYGVMFIPDYSTSVFMNNYYRKIKENINLDFIEESDDEDDFQNTNIDKHVDLNKILTFECKFHRKFKKWYPIVNVPMNSKIVHISKLVSDYY